MLLELIFFGTIGIIEYQKSKQKSDQEQQEINPVREIITTWFYFFWFDVFAEVIMPLAFPEGFHSFLHIGAITMPILNIKAQADVNFAHLAGSSIGNLVALALIYAASNFIKNKFIKE